MISSLVYIIKNTISSRLLLLNLTRNDFTTRFAGTKFGVFWGIIQPAMTIVVYWVAFQYGFRSGEVDGYPFILWFLPAIVAWIFFAEAISMSCNCFIEYSYLVKKVVFNIDILPLVKILASLLLHVAFLVIVTFIFCLCGNWPGIYILQLFYYISCMITFIFALALINSSCVIFFRDLTQIISTLLLLGMWCTPIAWNMKIMPEEFQKILVLNPIYYVIEGYRDCFLRREFFWEKSGGAIYFWIVTICLLLVGSNMYCKLKPHFADTI